jgi:hypothetical protein
MKKILCLISSLCLPGLASAQTNGPAQPAQIGQFVTAENLYEMCSSPDANGQNSCGVYILGAYDMLAKVYNSQAVAGLGVCMNGPATEGDIIFAVRRYLEANPASRQYAASDEILLALRQAYPCS